MSTTDQAPITASPGAAPSAAAPPAAAPSALSDAAALAGRAVRLSLRDPVTFTLALALPIMLMLLITGSFARMLFPDGGYSAYLDHSLPLFVLMGIAFALPSTALAVVADLRSGFDARLRTMPVAGFAPLAGRLAADVLRGTATVVIVTAVGSVIGFRFTAGPSAAVGFLLLPLLFGLGLGCLAIAIAAVARDGEVVAALLNVLLLVLSFLSTGLVPLEDLPGWAQPVARVNPFSVVIEAMRDLAHGGPTAGHVLGAVAWSVGLVAVFGTLAARRLRLGGTPT